MRFQELVTLESPLENRSGIFYMAPLWEAARLELPSARRWWIEGGGNAMNVKDLVPWGKHRHLEKRRFAESGSPFLALHREMNRMFDDFLRDFDVPGRGGTAWPHIEISETDDEIKVMAELAGLEQRDVDITHDDGVLTLKGQKSLEKNGTLYSERWEGAFERMIPVGQDVDPDKVKASFRNGVLTVRLSKKPEAQRQAKRIAVQ
jgi:HSP20 family protein